MFLAVNYVAKKTIDRYTYPIDCFLTILIVTNFLSTLQLILVDPLNTTSSDYYNETDLSIETEIGPEFKETDSEEIEACSLNVFANKFPLDFVQAPVLGSKRTCPELTMFGMTHQACFIEEFMDLPKTIYILDEAGIYLNSRAFQFQILPLLF